MRKGFILMVAALPLLSGGCLAKAAFDVATLPVKAGAKAVDWTTTSQEEADRNYGRKMREQEAREGREAKREAKEAEKQRKREQRRRDDEY